MMAGVVKPLTASDLRHPKEVTYLAIGAIVGGIVWLLLLPIILMFVWLLIPVVIVLWITEQFFRAELLGNSVKVSDQQYPEIHAIVKSHARILNLGSIPVTGGVPMKVSTNPVWKAQRPQTRAGLALAMLLFLTVLVVQQCYAQQLSPRKGWQWPVGDGRGFDLSWSNDYASFNRSKNNNMYHVGVDVSGQRGTAVYAAADGIVKWENIYGLCGEFGGTKTAETFYLYDYDRGKVSPPVDSGRTRTNHGLGMTIIIEHDNPIGTGKIYTLYAHLDAISKTIYDGAKGRGNDGFGVKKGQFIGLIGSSTFEVRDGSKVDPSFKPHLHFEVKTEPELAAPKSDFYWGYVPDLPDAYGYIDPALVIFDVGLQSAVDERKAYRVTAGEGSVIRTGPSRVCAVLGLVDYGQVFVSRRRLVRSSDEEWVEIDIPNAKGFTTAWIAKRFGGKDRLIEEPNVTIVYIKLQARLRKGPGTNYSQLQVWNNLYSTKLDVFAWPGSYFVSSGEAPGPGSDQPWHCVYIPRIYDNSPGSGERMDKPTGGLNGRMDPARWDPATWKARGTWQDYKGRNGVAWIAGDLLRVVSPPSPVRNMIVTPDGNVDFGSILLGREYQLPITIKNASNSNAVLSGSVGITGGGFSIQSNGGDFQLNPGEQRVVMVRFSPNRVGVHNGTLTITHNATSTSSPKTIALSGNGRDANAPTISNVRLSPANLPVSGGIVTIRADVTDDTEVRQVWAELQLPNGSTARATMVRETGSTYKGDYSVPENRTASEQRYWVKVVAEDSSLNQKSTGWDYSFVVAPRAVYLDVSPGAVDFGSVAVGGSKEMSITLTNRSSSTGNLRGRVSVSGGDFSIVSGSGDFNLARGGSRTVTVRFSPTADATRRGVVQITHDATNQTTPLEVPLSGTGAAARISVTPSALTFSASQGNNPSALTVVIQNIGTATLNWSASKESGSGWFSFSPTSGSVSTGGTQSITVNINSAGLQPGTYTDNIVVRDPNAVNSPQRVSITLVVTSAPKPTIEVTPSRLAFTTERGRNPSSQTITIRNTGTAALNWSASKRSGEAWLSFSPSSGTVSVGGSQTVTVSVNAATLQAGTYTDGIVVRDPNAVNSPRSVDVSLEVIFSKYTTVLQVENASGRIGQEVTLRATLRRTFDGAPLAGRAVVFRVESRDVGSAMTDSQGTATLHWTVEDWVSAGRQPMVAYFEGDEDYESAHGSGQFTRDAPTLIFVDDSEHCQGDQAILGAYLVDADAWRGVEGRKLRFYVDGRFVAEEITAGDGLALVPFTVPADVLGSQLVTVEFAGDDVYGPSSGWGRLVVRECFIETQLEVQSAVSDLGDEVTLQAMLRTEGGQPLPGFPVAFVVDQEYIGEVITDQNGVAEIPYRAPLETPFAELPLEVVFAGDSEHVASYGRDTLIVRLVPTYVEAFYTGGARGEVVRVGATLWRTDPGWWPLEGYWLDFYLDGEYIGGGVTDAYGSVVGGYAIPPDAAGGEHRIEVVFSGDSVLSPAVGSGTLWVYADPVPVSGTVELQSFIGDVTKVPVTIEMYRPGSPYPDEVRHLNLDGSGAFSFESLLAGYYLMYADAPHWLRQGTEVFLIRGTVVHFSLINGDIDGDNEVTLFDFGSLVAAFGTVPGDANWNPNADLDGDEEVTLFDFGILVRNFGAVGDE
jgi:murein DD-endopeptidase MepM/ murein hydrolase activator NlpD